MSLRRTLQLLLAVVVASLALALGTAAGAVDNPDYTSPPPSSQVHNPPPNAPRAVQALKPSRQRLAITGSDVGGLLLVGGVLVAGGAGTLVLRRRSIA